MENNIKKIIWKEAATGGLYLGLSLVVILFIGHFFKLDTLDNEWLTGVMNFVALVAFNYFFAKKISFLYGDEGFSYPQSLGFILKMMLFAGVIAGVGQCLLNVIDPQHYLDTIEVTYYNMGFTDEQIEQAMAAMWMIKNPVIMALSGAFSMLIYGGLIGLVVSAFVKRPADPFANMNNNNNNSQPE